MCFYYDDSESAEFWTEKIVKARKPRKCNACNGAIEIGDLYDRITYLFEGDFETLHYCGVCHHTRYMIHLEELEKGCREYDSWCQHDDLWEALNSGEYKTERSSHEAGQKYLKSLIPEKGRCGSELPDRPEIQPQSV